MDFEIMQFLFSSKSGLRNNVVSFFLVPFKLIPEFLQKIMRVFGKA